MKLWGSKEQQIAGFFDQGTSITGELQFSGIVRIDGSFHGSIDSSDTLIVGINAVIHADIRVREIEIHGQVFGNIEVEGRAEIHSSGNFRGDIHTPILIIHEGGKMDGQSHMTAESELGDVQARESTRVAPKKLDDRRRSLDRDTGQ